MAAAALAAAVGAAILGEYELDGMTPVVAGILFGLIIAELVTAVARRRDLVAAAASALVTALGVMAAAWRSTGPHEDWSLVPDVAWLGVVLGAIAAALWVRTPGRRAAGSRPLP